MKPLLFLTGGIRTRYFGHYIVHPKHRYTQFLDATVDFILKS